RPKLEGYERAFGIDVECAAPFRVADERVSPPRVARGRFDHANELRHWTTSLVRRSRSHRTTAQTRQPRTRRMSRARQSVGRELPKAKRVLHREALLVIVEVREHVSAFAAPRLHALGPLP